MSRYKKPQEKPSSSVQRKSPKNQGAAKPAAEQVSGNAPAQVSRLTQLSSVQRQVMMENMSQTQGNQEVQRMINSIQREAVSEKDAGGATSSNQEALINNAVQSGGSPIPEESRNFFSSQMGYDFDNVRVHTGDKADEAASAVNAEAFTLGNDLVFKEGQYAPGTGGGDEMLAHELTHVVQQGAAKPNVQQGEKDGKTDSIAPTGKSQIQRWSGHEHKAFGNGAAKLAERYSSLFTVTPNVAFGKDKKQTMSLGDATELSGDYAGNPQQLSNVKTIDPKDVSTSQYLSLASTNINHFFPLAAKEWRTQHATAMGLAAEARDAYAKGQEKSGDRLTRQAMQAEAFGLHFMQDSFASGHQFPRALEAVDANKFTTGFSRGLKGSKNYHDVLCSLPNGIDMQYGKKFHGDDLGDPMGQDQEVTQESYNSLVEVLSTISGKKPADAKRPRPNWGPDIPAIMRDPDAGPVWYSLEHSLTEMLENARDNGDGTVTTDSGITYDIAEIMEDWEGRGVDEETLAKLNSTNPDLVTKLVDATLSDRGRVQNMSRDGMGGASSMTFDSKADNAIVKLLTNKDGALDVNMVPETLTVSQTVMLCQALISGACVGLDEHAVLFILRRQKPEVFREAVKKLTIKYLDSGLDGEEWDTFLLVCANRYEAGKNLGAQLVATEKNDDAARMLINGWEKGGEPAVPMRNLSPQEWIGVVNALLSGSCTNADEDAIVAIVTHLVRQGKASLIDSGIGEKKMDRGVDGKQWRKIRSIMNKAGYEWDS